MAYTIFILTFLILISVSVQQTPSVTRECKVGEFRSLVSIQFDISNPKHVCSGAIIHISYILTAANCMQIIHLLHQKSPVNKKKLEDNVLVIAGDLRNDKLALSESRQSLVAERFFIHENFHKYQYHHDGEERTTYQNNIALIKVLGEYDVTNHVKIGITRSDSIEPGMMAIAAGWGSTSNDVNKSEVCLAIETTVLEKDKCNYPADHEKLDPSPTLLNERQICVGDLADKNNLCRSDAGSPLYAYKDDVIQVVGILSYHGGCGLIGYGGVYSDVSMFNRWMLKTVRWKQDKYDGDEYVPSTI